MADLLSAAPLPPERWRVLSPYLDQALELTTGELDSWLERMRQHDAGIARDIETLLGERDALRSATVLERGRGPAPPAVHAGTRGGAIPLVSPLGRGGLGARWRPHR